MDSGFRWFGLVRYSCKREFAIENGVVRIS